MPLHRESDNSSNANTTKTSISLHNVQLQQNPTMQLLLMTLAVSFINAALSTGPGIVLQEQHKLEACLPLTRTCVKMLYSIRKLQGGMKDMQNSY